MSSLFCIETHFRRRNNCADENNILILCVDKQQFIKVKTFFFIIAVCKILFSVVDENFPFIKQKFQFRLRF